MRNSGQGKMMLETYSIRRQNNFGNLFPNEHPHDQFVEEVRLSNMSDEPPPPSENDSPNDKPPWDNPFSSSSSAPTTNSDYSSPLSRSPWSSHVHDPSTDTHSYTGLVASLVREEGNIYSLATMGDLLYTGSDSKNIRVWKNQSEFSMFKASSGLIKAIVITADRRIFTGHQDGKIRVWKVSGKNPSVHKRVGTLPTLKSFVKKSMKPSNYVETRKNHNAVWIKHFDAISSLSLNDDQTLLYSASWDKTIKVWRVSDSKCLESITAHDDAVNAVVTGFDSLIFTGSADGTVKSWRRELQGKGTKHFFSRTLLKQECAVTSLAVDRQAYVLYAGSSDGLLSFWERDKLMSHGGVLRGHKLAVLCLAAGGNMVFSGSADTNICVWRREEGGEHKCLYVLNGHSGPVKCLAVEDDHDRTCLGGGECDRRWTVYSGSLDKSVKIWKVCTQAARPPVAAAMVERHNSSRVLPSVYSFSSQGRMSVRK